MAEFQVGKWYTEAEMRAFLADKNTRETVKVQGGVLQTEPTRGRLRIVPWTAASHAPNEGRDITKGGYRYTVDGGFDIKPVRKRTPQERMRAMMDRLVGEYKLRGTIPGKTDPEIQALVGEFHRYGIAEVDGEFIRKVAQHFLDQAKREQARNDHRKIVSTPGTDRVPNV